jgi:hypothetical protein
LLVKFLDALLDFALGVDMGAVFLELVWLEIPAFVARTGKQLIGGGTGLTPLGLQIL